MSDPLVGTGPSRATAHEIKEKLAVRYAWPEWLFATELTLEGRRVDAIAVRLWGGGRLGYRAQAFEIKVARSDWLRELQDFDKQGPVLAAVDDFYVVASRDVVRQEELPKGWGWLEWTGKVLRLKVQAALGTPKSATLPRELLARLATLVERKRHAGDADEARALEARIRPEVEERVRRQLDRGHEALREKAERYDALVAELGIKPHESPWCDAVGWLRTGRRVLQALDRMPPDFEIRSSTQRLTDLAERMRAGANEAEEALRDLRALQLAKSDVAPMSPLFSCTEPLPTTGAGTNHTAPGAARCHEA